MPVQMMTDMIEAQMAPSLTVKTFVSRARNIDDESVNSRRVGSAWA